jgi:hypothetical protein
LFPDPQEATPGLPPIGESPDVVQCKEVQLILAAHNDSVQEV